MSAQKDAKVVRDIIKRYGATLDLKATPYLIVEIIRQYGGKISGPTEADCLPPGGPPPKKFDLVQIAKELNARIADVSRLSNALNAAMNQKPKRGAAKRK